MAPSENALNSENKYKFISANTALLLQSTGDFFFQVHLLQLSTGWIVLTKHLTGIAG
jgi:hypothetical protein